MIKTSETSQEGTYYIKIIASLNDTDEMTDQNLVW
jgi:hypothetical protein